MQTRIEFDLIPIEMMILLKMKILVIKQTSVARSMTVLLHN